MDSLSEDKMLYVITGLPDKNDVLRAQYSYIDGYTDAFRARVKDGMPMPEWDMIVRRLRYEYAVTVSAFIQKYVAIGSGPFKPVWADPVRCDLAVRGLECWLYCSQWLYFFEAEIRNAEEVGPGTGMKTPEDSKRLAGLEFSSFYSFEHGAGIILGGEHHTDPAVIIEGRNRVN